MAKTNSAGKDWTHLSGETDETFFVLKVLEQPSGGREVADEHGIYVPALRIGFVSSVDHVRRSRKVSSAPLLLTAANIEAGSLAKAESALMRRFPDRSDPT